jgi:hypothetical protein
MPRLGSTDVPMKSGGLHKAVPTLPSLGPTQCTSSNTPISHLAEKPPTYVLWSISAPKKAEPNGVRYTVSGNLIEYSGNVSTSTADITTAKVVIKSVLSTPAATSSCFDISNFYLNTPMKHYEYMRIPVWAIPTCIMKQYNLTPLVHNGSVLVVIRKGMYGLLQAGLIAYEQLVKHLAKYMATIPLATRMDSGPTRSIPFSFPLLSTILASKAWDKCMQTISSALCGTYTPLPLIGLAPNISGSRSNGTMSIECATY